ncbi:MAG: hypothetical protein QM756_29410 [Polyangiaceae bacterium]
MDIKALLPVLLPRAIDWCERVSAEAASTGAPLKATALSDAQLVGVARPERIRVLVVDAIPTPDDRLLATAAASIGFLGAATAGLALGYSIFVRRGRLSRRLLSHECRHVAQFENEGSLAEFLTTYLNEIVRVGYEDCSFEVDARNHELPNADLTWRPISGSNTTECGGR